MKGLIKALILCALMAAVLAPQARAAEFMVNEKPMNLFFYITQGVGYGLHDDYDTKKGVQSGIMNLFVEGDYALTKHLKFYASGMFTTDWAYDLNAHSGSWNNRLFDHSRPFLYMDNEYWQILKEAHITWTPENFFFRAGKQIVAWGETDAFRLMDQINPLDESRGFADVEFENTLIPIWLLRAEYSPRINSTWLQELGFQFIFNPNVTFIPNKQILAGNNEGGIWAPNLTFPDPTVPFGEYRIGSIPTGLDKPRAFSSDGFEYGFRVRGLIADAVVTLNYFYGRENVPVTRDTGLPPMITMAYDGRLLIYPFFEGKYPLIRFVGGTFSRDIASLASSALGGVAPVIRLESFYAFNSTFSNDINAYTKSDEIRWALGVDWKLKIPFLNDKAMFAISPQVYHRHIVDYPRGYGLGDLQKNNWQTTLSVSTLYLNAKLTPSVFWWRDVTNRADMIRPQVTYDYSDNWRYTIGAMFLDGAKPLKSFELFDNKDYLFFKVSYKWG
jgi:hypothetical protein